MLPVMALPNTQMSPPVQTSAFAGVPTGVSAASRIPFHAVPATITSPEIYNNTRASIMPQGMSASAQSAAMAAQVNRLQIGGTPQVLSFTSQFMAQLMGQAGNDNELVRSMMQSTSPVSLTPDLEMLEQFSLTRYLPSNAALPRPEPSGVAPLARSTVQQVHVRAQPQPVESAQQAAAAARANSAPVVRNIEAVSSSLPADKSGEIRIQANRSERATYEPIKPRTSLLRSRGLDAYAQTAVRNAENLPAPPPVEAVEKAS